MTPDLRLRTSRAPIFAVLFICRGYIGSVVVEEMVREALRNVLRVEKLLFVGPIAGLVGVFCASCAPKLLWRPQDLQEEFAENKERVVLTVVDCSCSAILMIRDMRSGRGRGWRKADIGWWGIWRHMVVQARPTSNGSRALPMSCRRDSESTRNSIVIALDIF